MQAKFIAIGTAIAMVAGVSTMALGQVMMQKPVPTAVAAAANANLQMVTLENRVKALETQLAAQNNRISAQGNTIATLQTRLANTVSAYNSHSHNSGYGVPIGNFSVVDGKLKAKVTTITGYTIQDAAVQMVVTEAPAFSKHPPDILVK